MENQEHLTIKQAEVCELIAQETEENEAQRMENVTFSEKGKASQKIIGVRIFTGAVYECKAVILCTGTYLNARCLCGEAIGYTGPNGLQPAVSVSYTHLDVYKRQIIMKAVPKRKEKLPTSLIRSNKSLS